MKCTERMKCTESNWKAIAMRWNKGKAVILVSTLETTKIRSTLHTSQNADNVPRDQSQGQVLLEALLLPVVTRHISKFLCNVAQERGGRLNIHTSRPLNSDWLTLNTFVPGLIQAVVRVTKCWTKAHELNQLKNCRTCGLHSKVVCQHCT